MSNFRHIKRLFFLILLTVSHCYAHDDAIVEHHDYIQTDKNLTLSQVVSLTLEQFPDQMLNTARQQEANALQQRGNSWLAGAPNIAMRYQDDLPGDDIGSREIEAELELPLWNWGQRSAGQKVAEEAQLSVKEQSSIIKLDVAGLVRLALWNIELENIRYLQAKSNLDISQQLLNKIKRRVELGDLPRTDFLLAKSDHLAKRSLLTQAEAELMHARKSYLSLTQMSTIPVSFKEELSPIIEISASHPKLAAMNAVVRRKQAELKWVKSAGSGQSSFILGGKSEKDDVNADDIESMSVELSIPFGGSAHLAPEIASANLELTEAYAKRVHLFRDLEKEYHEAKHALEVSRTELKLANELKQISESLLRMTRLSFSAGETNLIDLLKIQAKSLDSIRLAKEQEIMLQKNIALYNQAVGVQP